MNKEEIIIEKLVEIWLKNDEDYSFWNWLEVQGVEPNYESMKKSYEEIKKFYE